MWTDENRAQQRTYLIFIGRKLKEKIQANLSEATVKWDDTCNKYTGNSCVTLFHDKRSIDNLCCQQLTS